MTIKWGYKKVRIISSFFCPKKKKTLQKFCRVLLNPDIGQKAKGEEKPEEELMGKRKSSPRLATTSSN